MLLLVSMPVGGWLVLEAFSFSKLSDMGLAQTTQTSTEGMVWSYDINVCTRMLMLNAKKHTNTFNILFLQAIDADQYLLICKLNESLNPTFTITQIGKVVMFENH